MASVYSSDSPVPLRSWSWQAIIRTYAVLGGCLKEYQSINDRTQIPHADIKYTDEENLFFLKFWREVEWLSQQIGELDREIARRNKLIGALWWLVASVLMLVKMTEMLSAPLIITVMTKIARILSEKTIDNKSMVC